MSEAKHQVKVLATLGISKKEWWCMVKLLQKCAGESNLELDTSAEESSLPSLGRYRPLSELRDEATNQTHYGIMGRIVVLQVPPRMEEEETETIAKFVAACHENMAQIWAENEIADAMELFQPTYIHTQTDDKVIKTKLVASILEKGKLRGLFGRYFPSGAADATVKEDCFVPTSVISLNQHIYDKAPNNAQLESERRAQVKRGVGVIPFPDWGTIAVLDHLVTDRLRARLLRVVLGGDNNSTNWDDDHKGPDPNRWSRNGVTDYPGVKNNNWGMAGENLYDIVSGNSPAMQEMEALIGQLFCDYHVARLALEDFLVTPINVNAPTRHETYMKHFDSNPLFPPPGPMFTSLYGKYNNRADGRPLFVSVLVYLMKEWKPEWGAPTSFCKFSAHPNPPQRQVEARPGRVVVMHSDIWHSVNPPTDAAGERPRYSMVWRLILYPKQANQSMRALHCGRIWPNPEEEIVG